MNVVGTGCEMTGRVSDFMSLDRALRMSPIIMNNERTEKTIFYRLHRRYK